MPYSQSCHRAFWPARHEPDLNDAGDHFVKAEGIFSALSNADEKDASRTMSCCSVRRGC